jgi:hypothetical protein
VRDRTLEHGWSSGAESDRTQVLWLLRVRSLFAIGVRWHDRMHRACVRSACDVCWHQLLRCVGRSSARTERRVRQVTFDRTRPVNKNPLRLLTRVDQTLEVRSQVVSTGESGCNLTAKRYSV